SPCRLTEHTRRRTHLQWYAVHWNTTWTSNFGDPYRRDRRIPYFGDHQLHMNPEDAKELGIQDGDYVYVDSNPEDRPFRGWQKDPARARGRRRMLRGRSHASYPRGGGVTKPA